MTQSNEEVRDFVGDRVLVPILVDQVLNVLAQNEDAAYLVWLKLGARFGSGQKL